MRRFLVQYIDDDSNKHWIVLESMRDIKFLMERFEGNVTILESYKTND